MYRHEVYDQLIPAEKIGFGAPRWGSVFQVPGWDGGGAAPKAHIFP